MRVVRRAALATALGAGAAAAVFAGSIALDRPSQSVHRELVVDARRDDVWRLLTDFARYEDWNPYITHASGRAREGTEVDLHIDPLHSAPHDVECDVIDVKWMRKIFWRCRDYAPGLLDREHTFRVLPLGRDRVRLVYDGRWEGIFVPFADLDDRKSGYRRMADALKRRAERTS